MSECIVCNQVVTNPVCVDCMEKEVEVWLFENRPDLISKLKDKTFEINFSSGETDCILCGNPMCICTYCYSEHLFSWLKKYPELALKFKKIFDFNYFFPSWISTGNIGGLDVLKIILYNKSLYKWSLVLIYK